MIHFTGGQVKERRQRLACCAPLLSHRATPTCTSELIAFVTLEGPADRNVPAGAEHARLLDRRAAALSMLSQTSRPLQLI